MMEEKRIEERREESEKILNKWRSKKYIITPLKNLFDKWIEKGDYEEILSKEEEERREAERIERERIKSERKLKKEEEERREKKRRNRTRLITIIISCFFVFMFIFTLIKSRVESNTRRPVNPVSKLILSYVRTNDKGYKEYRNEKDGSVLIYIPAGEFTMGSEENGSDEKPVHKVYLDGYYIMKYEVTNKQFVNFLNSIKDSLSFKDTITSSYKCRVAKNENDYIFEIYWDGYTKTESSKNWVIPIIYEKGIYKCVSGYENHPVVNVTWYGAKAYAEWAGLMLPTEAEWEKASRGTDGRKYPWGNGDPGTNRCNYSGSEDGYEYTSPVGSYENGRSPYGCYDMSGNVLEWCSDWYGSSYYRDSEYRNPKGPSSGTYRILRGGSWDGSANGVRSANRNSNTPSLMNYFYGFRCSATE